jgi:hypothetical protein
MNTIQLKAINGLSYPLHDIYADVLKIDICDSNRSLLGNSDIQQLPTNDKT